MVVVVVVVVQFRNGFIWMVVCCGILTERYLEMWKMMFRRSDLTLSVTPFSCVLHEHEKSRRISLLRSIVIISCVWNLVSLLLDIKKTRTCCCKKSHVWWKEWIWNTLYDIRRLRRQNAKYFLRIERIKSAYIREKNEWLQNSDWFEMKERRI